MRERLAALEPGGRPDRPIEVAASPVVDVRAREERCARCGGELTLDEHAAVEVAGEPLRLARLTCRGCGGKREIWFRLAPRRPN
jgi:hypothetical protein